MSLLNVACFLFCSFVNDVCYGCYCLLLLFYLLELITVQKTAISIQYGPHKLTIRNNPKIECFSIEFKGRQISLFTFLFGTCFQSNLMANLIFLNRNRLV